MGNYKEHILFGFFISFLFYLIPYMRVKIYYILPIIFIYSLLPDLDIATSLMRMIANSILLVLMLFFLLAFYNSRKLVYLYLIIIFILVLLYILQLQHRGNNSLHIYLFGAVLASPIYYIGLPYYIYSVGGYFSHLMLDKVWKIW